MGAVLHTRMFCSTPPAPPQHTATCYNQKVPGLRPQQASGDPDVQPRYIHTFTRVCVLTMPHTVMLISVAARHSLQRCITIYITCSDTVHGTVTPSNSCFLSGRCMPLVWLLRDEASRAKGSCHLLGEGSRPHRMSHRSQRTPPTPGTRSTLPS